MPEVEKVSFTKEVALVDAHGEPIREGSVLRRIDEPDIIGYVTKIFREGDRCSVFNEIGDVVIRIGAGSLRNTTQYDKWEHVPHNWQSYYHRYMHWLLSPTYLDDDSSLSGDEQLAVSGILALLPEGAIDWELGPYPDSLEQALEILAFHLDKVGKVSL